MRPSLQGPTGIWPRGPGHLCDDGCLSGGYRWSPFSEFTRIRRTAKGDNVPIQAGQPMWAHGNKCTMLDEWAGVWCVPVRNGWAGGI
ncbi:hypothetical protein BDR04DRAFT_1090448 [Suillus decipiens]|nr:hypothetical protein BDR04DRAFT_1090448 [Suillus decipiens]